MKRILTIVLTVVVLFGAGLPSNYAQASTLGEWKVYPSYWQATRNVVVGSSVYSLCNGNLFRYDTDDSSVKLYDCLNDLNDVRIQYMDYSREAKRLILVYDNGNIDLMDSKDNVVNISSLKDKTLSGKEVNKVFVAGKMAYLATGFGYITIDMAQCVVEETFQLNLNVQSMAVVDGQVWLGTKTGLYYADSKVSNLHQTASWRQIHASAGWKDMKIAGSSVYINYPHAVFKATSNSIKNIKNGDFTVFSQLSDDAFLFANQSEVNILVDGEPIQTFALDNEWMDVSTGKGNTYWVSCGDKGLCSYKLVDGSFVATGQCIQPNSPYRDLCYRISYAGDRLLVAGGSPNYVGLRYEGTAMYYEDGKWINFDTSYKESHPNISHTNFTELVQDPSDDSHHFVGSFRSGLYEFRNGRFAKHYDCDNSPIRSILPSSANYLSYCTALGVQYDADGNMWMFNAETDTLLRYIDPKGKWHSLYYSDLAGRPTPTDFLFTTSGVNFIVDSRTGGFYAFHTNGTLQNTRDDKHIHRATLTNEDGTLYDPRLFRCLTEDLDGRVWCGTVMGLFVIDDPMTFFDDNFRYNQIKIARNDGSGLADYLLNNVDVSCIAVDGANRKWIGTNGNGIFLVSPDGQEMIHHFLSSDSPLLSDNIQSIAVNHRTGEVMIGTDYGLCSYMSDATEAAQELVQSEVLAYPNPVRPDYNGPIRIEGLTYNSEVKILSPSGQLIMSGVSNGGTFVWNGCNKRGQRVGSGVYNVVANTEDGKKAVVCHLVVIK